MHIIQQIGLQVVEILTLVFGILGVTFSLLLMYSPNLTKSISSVFNRYVDIDDKVNYLDKDIQIDSYFYSHNMLFGTCLVAGSVFSLIFFFFKLDVSSFANIFFVSSRHLSTSEMIFSAVSWIGKVACVIGIFVGTMLVFDPNKNRDLRPTPVWPTPPRPPAHHLSLPVLIGRKALLLTYPPPYTSLRAYESTDVASPPAPASPHPKSPATQPVLHPPAAQAGAPPGCGRTLP